MPGRTTLALLLALAACDAPPAAAPVAADELGALQPVRTRAGHLRFTDPRLADPGAAAVFAARLAAPATPAAERLALAEALPRCGGAWAPAALQQLAVEADPEVRAVLVGGLRRADAPAARDGARAGLADASPRVRAAAATLAGWVPAAGDELRPALRARLADAAPEVRAAAARALGLLADREGSAALARGLGDEAAEVRLESLRALQRIDPADAAARPELAALRADADARVRRLAGR
jgi:HEAT repeat protein